MSCSLVAILGLCLAGHPEAVQAAQQDGVALAIIYDTSGSMGDDVRDTAQQLRPKYQIGNRALIALATHIEAYARNPGGAPRPVEAGLFIFKGDNARAVVPFGPFDAAAITKWARSFLTPGGVTPLGNSLQTAGAAVLKSPFPRKHILVITDGINTAGPEPAVALSKLKGEAAAKGAGISVHFVAFDIAAKVFDPVKKLDATVVSAANEAQLNTQLDFILQKKILLEDEEPTK